MRIFCNRTRRKGYIPVIFLTASDDEFSTVTGFEIGADDYVPKPFRPRELVSRIKNVLRRTGNTAKTVKLEDVVVDTEKGNFIYCCVGGNSFGGCVLKTFGCNNLNGTV